MYSNFGIGPMEIAVFLIIGATFWGLVALASATQTPRLKK